MVLGPTPSKAQFLFHIAEIELGVVDFTAREEISSPYEVDLTVASKDEIDFDDVIGKPAFLTILGDDSGYVGTGQDLCTKTPDRIGQSLGQATDASLHLPAGPEKTIVTS